MNSFLLRFKGYKKRKKEIERFDIKNSAQLYRGFTVLKNGLNF